MTPAEKRRKAQQKKLEDMRKGSGQSPTDFGKVDEYDSDSDLPSDIQRKIKENPSEASKLRKQAWEKAGTFSKLKKGFKTGMWGDKRSSKK